MQMHPPDNQEPKDPNSQRSSPKPSKARVMLFRYGIPALVGFLVVLFAGILVARAASTNFNRYNTREEPISAVLNLADQHVLKSVTINGNDIYAIDTRGQHYHAVKEDGQSVTEIFRHDRVIVTIDNGQQSQWMQLLLDFLFLGII